MELYLNGVPSTLDGLYNESELADSVYRSLFTWARAKADDELLNNQKFGWWGNALADDKSDEYGSRLWLFLRSKIDDTTCSQIEQICQEALSWMITDNIASSVEVTAERDISDKSRVNLLVTIIKSNSDTINLKFKDLWNELL